MAELLVKAVDASHTDITKDKRGCYKAGMVVEIRPDGSVYGTSEGLPNFYIIKIPLVPVTNSILLKLAAPQKVQSGFEADGTTPHYVMVRRRVGWLMKNSIPVGALNKLNNTGYLIIKANPAYNGPFDYTWTQVKNYFWDDDAQAVLTDEIT
jgi:hypothetical protein